MAKRLLSTLAVAIGFIVAAVRAVLDAIGWATVPDDLPVVGRRMDQLLDLLFLAPWWLPWVFAFSATAWLMWVSWPRPAALNNSSEAQQRAPLDVPPNNPFVVEADGVIRRQEINVAKLLADRPLVSHMKFEGCTFNGPAAVRFEECDFPSKYQFDPINKATLDGMRAVRKDLLPVFFQCEFRECKFVRIAPMLPDYVYNNLKLVEL